MRSTASSKVVFRVVVRASCMIYVLFPGLGVWDRSAGAETWDAEALKYQAHRAPPYCAVEQEIRGDERGEKRPPDGEDEGQRHTEQDDHPPAQQGNDPFDGPAVVPREAVMICSFRSLSSIVASDSGEREEELFEFGFGHRFLAVRGITGHTFTQTGSDNLEACAIQCTRHRRELGDHVLAVAALLDHRDHPRRVDREHGGAG